MSFWSAVLPFVVDWAADQFLVDDEGNRSLVQQKPKPQPFVARKMPGLDVKPFSYDRPTPTNKSASRVVDQTAALTSVGSNNDPRAAAIAINRMYEQAAKTAKASLLGSKG